jgi:hypothetical protein
MPSKCLAADVTSPQGSVLGGKKLFKPILSLGTEEISLFAVTGRLDAK